MSCRKKRRSWRRRRFLGRVVRVKTAKMSKGVLVRFDGATGHKEEPVDFKAILEGKKPDIVMQADDIVFIPGSAGKEGGVRFRRSRS